MPVDVLATIAGELADRAMAEALAREVQALVNRAQGLACIVEIRERRLGGGVHRCVTLPRQPPPGG